MSQLVGSFFFMLGTIVHPTRAIDIWISN